MVSALKDLASLISKSRDGVLPSIQVFPPIDINTVAKDLELERHGQSNGSRNQPPQDSDLEDSVEGDVFAEIQQRAWKAGEEYRTQLDLYDGRIRQATVGTDQRVAIEQAGQD